MDGRVSEAWLRWPRPLFYALIAGAGLALPAVSIGLNMDDFFHVATLRGGIPSPARPLDLFRFAFDPATTRALMRSGPFPWWTIPELKLAFWRPLSSALAAADHHLFGDQYLFHHLHSLLWYLALICVVALLLRRWLPELAVPALLLFTIDDAHWTPVCWLANRNALVAAVPALLGLVAHVKWREERWRWGLPLSLLLYAVGLAGGEAALGVFAYLLAYEVALGPGRRVEQLKALIPVACLGVAYIVTYRVLGYGAWGSSTYLDPVTSPGAFLWAAPGRALALLGAGLLALPADLWALAPSARPVLVLGGAAGLALFVWLGRKVSLRLPDRERRALMGLGLGGMLSLLPVLATFPSNRTLLLPSIGGAAWVAALLRAAWRQREQPLQRVVLAALLFLHVVVAVVSWPALTWAFPSIRDAAAAATRAAPIPDEGLSGRSVVLVNSADMMTGVYAPILRWMDGHPQPRAWWPLSMAPRALRLTRTSDRAFELEAVDRPFVDDVFEQVTCSRELSPKVGAKVPLNGAEVTVLEERDGLPSKIRFEAGVPLEDPSLLLLQWKDGRFAPLVAPPVGQSLELPRARSPLDAGGAREEV